MNKLKQIPIVHVNTADSWRGGEKQTYYLTSCLNQKGYLSSCICREGSPLHEKLRDNRLPCFPVKIFYGIDVLTGKKIAGILKRTGAGILHLHTAHSHSAGYLSSFFYRVPVNIVSRRVDFHIKKNLFSRLKYNYPDKYVTVSGAIRDILVSDGIPAEKIKVVHSGVDLDAYKNIESGYLYKEFAFINNIKKKVKLVNVAALTPQKDQATLIKAIAIAVKQFSNLVLFIAGEGKLKDPLTKLRDSLGLKEHIVFTGFRNDAFNLTDFADIFVMSSRWEGLGTSIIDAMALKKPVIAANTGGIPELVRDRENGLLIEKENPEALAGAIVALIKNKSLRKKLSARAFRDAQGFSIKETVAKTIEVYGELCGLH
ncbi:MAG: glycosyltransferase family 4 protein [Spirochaetota bacterium]